MTMSSTLDTRETPAPGDRVAAPRETASGGRRLAHVEVVRGLVCALVVVYHAIGSDPLHGLRLPEGSWPWMLNRFLDLVDMPLFAFVSGWVFGIVTDRPERFVAAFGKKFIRLGVPLIVVTAIYLVLVRVSGHGVATGVWAAYLLPFEHLWYLQASLWLLAVAAVGSWIFRRRPMAFAVGITLASIAAFLAVPTFEFNLLSIQQAIYLAPYFFLGHLLARTSESGLVSFEGSRDLRIILPLIGLMAFALTAVWILYRTGATGVMQSAPALLFAIALALAVSVAAPHARLLEALGQRSYTIYLFHVISMAPTRMILLKIWPDIPLPLAFVIIVGAGLAVPSLIHAVVSRHPASAFLIEGIVPRRRGATARGEAT